MSHTEASFALRDPRSSTTYDLIMNRLTPSDADLSFLGPLLSSSQEVLDVGCGTGRVGRHLATHVNKLVGFDRSPEMLDRYRDQGVPDNVDLILGSVADRAAFEVNRFDAAIAILGSLNYVEDTLQFTEQLKNVATWVAPNGVVVLDVFSTESYSTMEGHHKVPIDIDGTLYDLTLDVTFDGKTCTCVTNLSTGDETSSGFTETFLPLTKDELERAVLRSGLSLHEAGPFDLHPGFHCVVAYQG